MGDVILILFHVEIELQRHIKAGEAIGKMPRTDRSLELFSKAQHGGGVMEGSSLAHVLTSCIYFHRTYNIFNNGPVIGFVTTLEVP